jgi:hypothetical protein
MSNHVYIPTGRLFTVGFYDPSGQWIAESDHETQEAAATRVHYLNGGTKASPPKDASLLAEICRRIADPGSYLSRGDEYREPIFNWSARAVAELFSTRFEMVNEVLRSNSVELEKLRRENHEARESLTAVRKQRDDVIAQLGKRDDLRNMLIGSINRIAKMVGMNVENAAFDAVERNTAMVVEARDSWKSMHQCASARLEYIEELFLMCPHAQLFFNGNEREDEMGAVPLGWNLRINAERPIKLNAEYFLDLISAGIELRGAILAKKPNPPKDTEYTCNQCGNKFMDRAGITNLICDDCIPF